MRIQRSCWKLLVSFLMVVFFILPVVLILLLKQFKPPLTTGMVRAQLSGHQVSYVYRPMSEFPVYLAQAAIMSEDGRFCKHAGVDWIAVTRELRKIGTGRKIYGASTISMQTARSVFLWQGRSYLRKLLEVPLAMGMDALLSKRRMMEVYLNIAEFGSGIYGVEAASIHYFGKPAARLSAMEASLLITTLPRPHDWAPNKPTRKHNANAMRNVKYIRFAEPFSHCLDLQAPRKDQKVILARGK